MARILWHIWEVPIIRGTGFGVLIEKLTLYGAWNLPSDPQGTVYDIGVSKNQGPNVAPPLVELSNYEDTQKRDPQFMETAIWSWWLAVTPRKRCCQRQASDGCAGLLPTPAYDTWRTACMRKAMYI